MYKYQIDQVIALLEYLNLGKVTLIGTSGDDLRYENGRIVTDFFKRASSDRSVRVLKTRYNKVKEEIIKFNAERGCNQFHSPENLAKSISIEAGELLECFQWDNEYNKEEVCSKLADIMNYCILLANKLDVEIEKIILNKLSISKEKYPINKSKGKNTKYNKL